MNSSVDGTALSSLTSENFREQTFVRRTAGAAVTDTALILSDKRSLFRLTFRPDVAYIPFSNERLNEPFHKLLMQWFGQFFD